MLVKNYLNNHLISFLLNWLFISDQFYLQIPVYRGEAKPIVKDYNATDYFGKDGFGDFNYTGELPDSVVRTKTASQAMIQLSKEYSGNFK